MVFGKIVERIFIIVVVIVITAGIVFASGKYVDKKTGERLQDGCPTDMVFVPSAEGGFCIDKYEASAGEDCPFDNPGDIDKTIVNLNNRQCKPVSVKGGYPWRYISKTQAAAACAKAGKRLPSAKEWHLASLGTPDALENMGENFCQIDNNWDEQPGKAGSAADCVSGAGAYDMIGNVWEWVDALVREGKYEGTILPESGFVAGVDNSGIANKTEDEPNKIFNSDYFWIKSGGTRQMARGGYWDSKEKGGSYAIYAVAESDYIGTGIGFRCVK